jgi:hypothetical protein
MQKMVSTLRGKKHSHVLKFCAALVITGHDGPVRSIGTHIGRFLSFVLLQWLSRTRVHIRFFGVDDEAAASNVTAHPDIHIPRMTDIDEKLRNQKRRIEPRALDCFRHFSYR